MSERRTIRVRSLPKRDPQPVVSGYVFGGMSTLRERWGSVVADPQDPRTEWDSDFECLLSHEGAGVFDRGRLTEDSYYLDLSARFVVAGHHGALQVSRRAFDSANAQKLGRIEHQM